MLKRLLKAVLSGLGLELSKCEPNNPADFASVTLEPSGEARGRALFSFVIEPFLRAEGEPISNAHTHDWESVQMAQTFLDLGYVVDVISYRNTRFIPSCHYDLFVSARTNLERIAQHLDPDCIKIAHLDTAHWLSNNHAAYARLLALKQRRGVVLSNRKMVEQNRAIEAADVATVLGNEFTMDTYRYANKPILRVPISTTSTYPYPEEKDLDQVRRHYLWFGSAGLVHKGLDVVLEAFAALPDYHLTVCGPISGEEEFEQAFRKELYETENIRTVGWVDVESEEFREILDSCLAVIYPSASEGGGGCVITCMHAGLIPVVTYEASVDIEDFGVLMDGISVEAVTASVIRLSAMPVDELQRRLQAAWQYVGQHHTREAFAENFRKAIHEIYALPTKC